MKSTLPRPILEMKKRKTEAKDSKLFVLFSCFFVHLHFFNFGTFNLNIRVCEEHPPSPLPTKNKTKLSYKIC